VNSPNIAAELITDALASGRSSLDESQSKALFRAYGIAVPEGEIAKTEAEAVAAAGRLGTKVVMKGMAAGVQHKTETGLVVLAVEGPDEAVAAYNLLEERAGGKLEAVLVEQMVLGNRELMVGMKRDAAFGPVVAFGLGGILTEALGDVALAVAPVDEKDAIELQGLIRAKRVLEEFRGYPPVDRIALARLIGAVGQMALDNPEIVEIDANPVLIEGDRPIAADALVILAPLVEHEQKDKRKKRAFKPDMRALMAPRSVAIVGASSEIGKAATRARYTRSIPRAVSSLGFDRI
jgi:succinyl-CoA synthetase beta subunit